MGISTIELLEDWKLNFRRLNGRTIALHNDFHLFLWGGISQVSHPLYETLLGM
jgi:hypothetical protein